MRENTAVATLELPPSLDVMRLVAKLVPSERPVRAADVIAGPEPRVRADSAEAAEELYTFWVAG